MKFKLSEMWIVSVLRSLFWSGSGSKKLLEPSRMSEDGWAKKGVGLTLIEFVVLKRQ